MGGVGLHLLDWTRAILPHPSVCLRPGFYCISSPVYHRRVIEPAFIQSQLVLKKILCYTHTYNNPYVSNSVIHTTVKQRYMYLSQPAYTPKYCNTHPCNYMYSLQALYTVPQQASLPLANSCNTTSTAFSLTYEHTHRHTQTHTHAHTHAQTHTLNLEP